MQSRFFYSAGIGLISGMILAQFISPDQIMGSLGWIILGMIVWIFLLQKLVPMKRKLPVFLITLIFFSLGFLRTTHYHRHYPFNRYDEYHNKQITVVGTIQRPPVFQPGKQQVRIHPTTIDGKKIIQPTMDIVIHTSDLLSFTLGDTVVVSGKFSLRQNFTSDTDRTVQYRLMSYSRKISGDIRFPVFERIIPSSENIFSNFLVRIKNHFITTLHQLYVAPGSGLLSGIIIGDTSSLDTDMLDIFRMVGLIHIVVLSGYNITLVANFFVRMAAPLGYYRRLIIAMIALVIFIGIVGVSQTSLRAGIMALCAFSARYFIKPYMITRGILLALVIMTWISPYAILFDMSLQLSFLATIGIVYIFPLLQDRFQNLAEKTFGEILLQTLAVNVVTLPLIIYQMGYFSPVTFPVNIAVLGFIPWITVFGFLSIFIGMILPILGKIVAFPIQVIIDVIIRFSTWTAQHDPWGMVVQPFSVWIMIGIYAMIFSWLVLLLRNSK